MITDGMTKCIMESALSSSPSSLGVEPLSTILSESAIALNGGNFNFLYTRSHAFEPLLFWPSKSAFGSSLFSLFSEFAMEESPSCSLSKEKNITLQIQT